MSFRVSSDHPSLPVSSQMAAAPSRCSLGSALFRGLASSRPFRATLLTGVAVGILFLVTASPPGWVLSAVIAGSFVLGLIFPPSGRIEQEIEFETSAIIRLFKKNYNEIIVIDGVTIFLGALPNALRGEGERLVKKENVGTVVSLNETWERKPLGLSIPYSGADWKALGVDYHTIDVDDHSLLSNDQLTAAANAIAAGVQAKKNVYVHCRAGIGRSAMAVAAYLIQQRNYSVDGACDTIKSERPISTILKKKGDGKGPGLISFANHVTR